MSWLLLLYEVQARIIVESCITRASMGGWVVGLTADGVDRLSRLSFIHHLILEHILHPNNADDPQAIVRLVKQVIAVSVETVQIVAALPALVVVE